MSLVTGTEYAAEAEEYGREPRVVMGKLDVRHAATFGYDQYFIDGTLVDPTTIRSVTITDAEKKFADLLLVRMKGDVEGHEFHGNQWSGGSGLGDVHPGITMKGDLASSRLNQAMFQAEDRRTPAEVKIGNVVAVGDKLAERVATNPELKEQLTAIGERAYGAAAPERLGYSSYQEMRSTSPTEVGARYVAMRCQSTWAQSSSDTRVTSVALQYAVGDRFGGELGSTPSDTLAGSSTQLEWGLDFNEVSVADAGRAIADSPAMREYVDVQYGFTQDALKEAGITELAAYRGMGWASEAETPAGVSAGTHAVSMNPLSSFSLEPHTANIFASDTRHEGNSYVFTGTVPADRVFSYPLTGPGCLDERELTVLGGTSEWAIERLSGG